VSEAEKEIWYLCDPEKNPACGKSTCYAGRGPCMMTKHREAAMKTKRGRAILVIIRRRGRGFTKTLREEDVDGRMKAPQ